MTEELLTHRGAVGARDGDVVRMRAVVRTLTPRAMTTVDQRRLVAMTTQSMKPHAEAGARAEVVTQRITVPATVTASSSSTSKSSSLVMGDIQQFKWNILPQEVIQLSCAESFKNAILSM